MIKTTPFHERLSELNTTGLYSHWSGYLSALRYDTSAKHEYFGIRNSAGYFDTSPLYKHWIRGKDAEAFLGGVMTRDIRTCRPGRAQYTVWSDDDGYILEDGVLFRHSDNEFLLTCAEPNVGYLQDLVGRLQVDIEDVSEQHAILAVQGPSSRKILQQLAPEVTDLAFFGLVNTKIGKTPVTISRTGYTGDLGYEVTIPADDAIAVLDAVIKAGTPYGMRPFGEEALLMARIEAGLVLINVEFSSSRFAYNDHQRVTAKELGFGWMLKGIDNEDRPFIGRDAIRREIADKTSRWATVGLQLDWADYNRLYNEAGLIPPKDETPLDYESMLYDDKGERVGYATSLMYSPVLQRHIALARVHPDLASVGSRVNLELTINHQYKTVAADVAKLPLFNPPRKTASA
jgi:aminomethyltransferase